MEAFKKVFYSFSFLLLLLACTDEAIFEKNTLTATISNDLQTGPGDNKSKIQYNNDPLNKIMNISWYTNDSIGVFGSNKGSNIPFSTNEANIFDNGKTAVFTTSETRPEGSLTAYYPFQRNATLSNGELMLTMPQQQLYTTDKSGIVIPYALANFMVAKPATGADKITFSNVFSLLQIGLYQSQDSVVKQLVFRDLSGKPVSGAFRVKWTNDIPEAVFPEEGSQNTLTITLDCGEGLPVATNSLVRFYLVVPAREYPKGFQIDFLYENGGKVTKTIGVTSGKTLNKGMLYPIGDSFSQPDEFEYTVSDGVTILNPEQLSKLTDFYISPTDNSLSFYVGVGSNIAAKQNEIIVVNKSSSDLPVGYAGKVTSIYTNPDGSQVIRLEPVRELTEVFNELKMGDPLWNTDGSPSDGMGVALDLASYLKEVTTENGAEVPFSTSGSSIKMQVPIVQSAPSYIVPPSPNMSPFSTYSNKMLVGAADKFSPSYSSPTVSYTFNEGKDLSATVGIQVNMNTHISMSIHERTLEYLHFKATPVITFSSEFKAQYGKTYNKEIPLLVFHFAPIPVGPILVIPIMKLSAVADVKGKISLTTKLEYKKEMPFGFSYIQGEFLYRNYISEKQDTDIENPLNFTGKIQIAGSTAVGAKIYGGFKVYGILEATANIDSRIRLKSEISTDLSEASQSDLDNGYFYNTNSNVKLEVLLNPSIGVGVTSLGGLLNGKLQSDALEILLMEKYLLPKFADCKFTQNQTGKLNISMDIKNPLLFDAKIALTLAGPGISGYTSEIYKVDYSGPPKGKKAMTVNETVDVPDLWPGRSYTVVSKITINGITITHNVGIFMSAFNENITFTTSKAIGETVTLSITEAKGMNVWIDANNNKIEENGERYYQTANVVLGAQTITVYGNITYFNCSDNQIDSLDVSKCGGLQNLRCLNNEITTLDVSNCKEMGILNCTNNKLTSMITNKTGKLSSLMCGSNKLTTLNLSNHTNLTNLICDYNQLISLDVSNCPLLEQVFGVGNQLNAVNVANCNSLSYLDLSNISIHGANTTNLMNSLPDRVSRTSGLLGLGGCSGLISDLDIARGKNWIVTGGTWQKEE